MSLPDLSRHSSPSTVEPVPRPVREDLVSTALRQRAGVSESDLHYYWRVLYGRRWLVLAVTLFGFALAAVITLRQPRLFQAQATVEFKQPLPPGKDLRLSDPDASVPPALAVRLLTTKLLAARVINAEQANRQTWSEPENGGNSGLAGLWDGLNQAGAVLAEKVRVVLGAGRVASRSEDASAAGAQEWDGVDLGTINEYYSHIAIRPVAMTALADIIVTHPDPIVAARLANEHARAFLDMDVETKVASLNDAQSFFSQQLNEVKGKLEESRRALSDFQREHGILSLPKNNTTITRESLQQLNKLLTATQGERIVAEANARNAASMSDEELAETLPDPELQNLRQELLGLKARYEGNSKEYGANHPDMVALNAHIQALQGRLHAAGVQARNQLAAVLEVAQAKERELRQNFDALSKAAGQEDRQLVQLLILQRDLESNQALYTTLLQQAKEADLNSGTFPWTSVKMIDRAVVPTVATYPTTRRNLGMGLVLGFLFGVFGSILLDRLDTRVYTPDDVVGLLHLPSFGVVPDFRRLASVSAYGRPAAEIEPQPSNARNLVTLLHPSSMVSEAYRGIRTNLMFASPGRPPKTILVTSSQPSEGKTVTTVNLAASLALSGSRVLVVDADFRKPACHTPMKVSREPGLSNVLTGQCDLAAAVVQSPVFPNGNGHSNGSGLYILPAGVIPPNPAELLGSGVMTDLLNTLQEQFEFVLIDSPPVLAVTDSVVIATKTDGVLMVVRGGEWGRDVVEKALSQLEAVRANILGVVLNRVDVTRGGSAYYYYRHYYGSYYERAPKTEETVA